MRVGVPKEIKKNEHRIGLTPTAVREYVAHGHTVSIETGAGLGAGFTDADYKKAGAKIVADAKTIFAENDMIVKVKEPQKVEWEMLREDQILFTYLHLAPDPEQTKGLLASKCAAIAYETVTDDRKGLPLLAPMSEVAGRIAVFSAAETLLKHNGGMGLLFCGVPGVAPARVLVLGGGVVGLNADRLLLIVRQSPGAHASQCCAQTEQNREGFNEPHTVLLRSIAGVSCFLSNTLSCRYPSIRRQRRRF